MTHLLELLSQKGPEPLLLYFGIPLTFATVAAASELYVLYKKETHGPTKTLNTVSGWLAAGWFCWVTYQLVIQYWMDPSWRGPFDFVSMLSYTACVVPLLGMALVDLPWVRIRKRPERRLAYHAGFSALFVGLLFVSVMTAMWNG